MDKVRQKKIGVVFQDSRFLSFSFKAKNSWSGLAYFQGDTYSHVIENLNLGLKNRLVYEIIEEIVDDCPFFVIEEK